MLTLQQAVACLPGARLISGGVSFRGPGHGLGDLSARIIPDPNMRNGYAVTSFAGDDPIPLRDFVDAACGLPRFEPGADRRDQQRQDPGEALRHQQAREARRAEQGAETAARTERARRLWAEAERDPRGSLVQRYLEEHRGLELPREICGHAVRFHAAGPWEGERVPMMLAAFRDITTDEVCGVHRTHLDPTTAAKLGRKMLGRAASAAIKLTPDVDVTTGLTIGEGIETTVAGMALGLTPAWALGGVGAIAALPVLAGVECLTVLGERGAASAAAVEQVGTRWSDAGREVRVCLPRIGDDLNDAIRGATR